MNIINQHYNTKNNYGILQGVYSHKPNYESSATQYLMSYHCYYLFRKLKILSLPNRFARVLWQLKKIYLLKMEDLTLILTMPILKILI